MGILCSEQSGRSMSGVPAAADGDLHELSFEGCLDAANYTPGRRPVQ